MQSTSRLALPFMAASQTQKHVTHNEALLSLDCLVQLSAATRALKDPPASPADLLRCIIPTDATGAWQGRSGQIAAFQDGGWSYYAPREGWRCWVEDEAGVLVWRSGAWSVLPAGEQTMRLGVNTTADPANRLAVSSAASLFTHAGDDHRLSINKAAPTHTASVVFQSGFEGRAEIGLAGSDVLSFKVSADGMQWRTALLIDQATGRVSTPETPASGHHENLLLNGSFLVNQRAFEGGMLANGVYGPDRWRGSDNAQLTVGASMVQLTGEIAQTIESSFWQPGGLGGATLTLVVDSLAGAPLAVSIAGQSQSIQPGPGLKSATFLIPANAPDALVLTLAGVGTSFRQVQLVRGGAPLPFTPRPTAIETLLCQRYALVVTTAGAGPLNSAMAQTQTRWLAPIPLPQVMRATPIVSASGVARIYNASGAFSTVNAVSLASISRTIITLACDVDANVGAGVGMLYAMTPAPRFVIDADY